MFIMRVADYIIDYIYSHGTDTIFTLAGGGAMFLNDAVAIHPKIKCICVHHEQAATMAAEAYAKMKHQIGAVMVTSGPGSTNAITGLLEAYQNSIPLIIISSQTKTSQMIAYSGVPSLRQFGVQEVDIIPTIRSLTKYATVIDDPEKIHYTLECAYYHAHSGRPGPVWLDIPSDIAAKDFPIKQTLFKPPITKKLLTEKNVNTIITSITKAKRPLIIAGGGIKLAGANELFKTFINKTHIPVVVPDMGIDILEYNHPSYVGHGGTKGDRAANIIIQRADVIISLGSRLSVPFIGHEYDKWAPKAKKIVIDIDPEEHKKRTIEIDHFIQADVKDVISQLLKKYKTFSISKSWQMGCQQIKKEYALKNAVQAKRNTNIVNMYDAIQEISNQSTAEDVFVTDAGITAYVSTQCIHIKKNQRMIIPGATLTMGYNLPAIVGIWAASKKSRVLCITGDGSLQMNIHELATIAHHNIPAKVFITNNNGYLAIRTTQKLFFNKHFIGEGKQSGVSFPNTKYIAKGYGFTYYQITSKKNLTSTIKKVLATNGPVICDIQLPYWQDIITISSKKLENGKMVSLPIDDMFPFLSDEEKQKIDEILKVSTE